MLKKIFQHEEVPGPLVVQQKSHWSGAQKDSSSKKS
jgi:hypothetical protein